MSDHRNAGVDKGKKRSVYEDTNLVDETLVSVREHKVKH